MEKRLRTSHNNSYLVWPILFLLWMTPALAQPVASNDIGFQGLRLIDQGQFDEGIKLVNQAVDADPTNASWRLNIANLLYSQGLKHLKQGHVARAQNIWSFAEMHLEEAVDLFNPSTDKILLSEAYYVMGEIQQYGYSDQQKARAFYQQALDLYQHPRAQRAIDKLP